MGVAVPELKQCVIPPLSAFTPTLEIEISLVWQSRWRAAGA